MTGENDRTDDRKEREVSEWRSGVARVSHARLTGGPSLSTFTSVLCSSRVALRVPLRSRLRRVVTRM